MTESYPLVLATSCPDSVCTFRTQCVNSERYYPAATFTRWGRPGLVSENEYHVLNQWGTRGGLAGGLHNYAGYARQRACSSLVPSHPWLKKSEFYSLSHKNGCIRILCCSFWYILYGRHPSVPQTVYNIPAGVGGGASIWKKKLKKLIWTMSAE